MTHSLLFNAETVRTIWEPLVCSAEKNPALALLMKREAYRGAEFHYFRRGCRDGKMSAGTD